LTKPSLSYIPVNSDVENFLGGVRRHTHPHCNLGRGFVALHGVLPQTKLMCLYPVLCSLCNYTLAVDDYVEGRTEAQSLGVLADERNFVQHCLMSLTPDAETAESQQECSLYELCRLAATIYSLIAVFPLPTTTAPFAKLALQVKEQISKPNVHLRWNEAPQLMLWIIVMAAIASVDMSERSWFVLILERLINRLKLNSWAQMKEHLEDFMWFGSTSNADGLNLWKEIEDSSPFSL
jgi:hypothetical protein